ncbi:MAG: RNase adapter RapZ [Endomicrobiales bacterium]|nr:RNase adapter RapZ [Endomicrobiales bacterium]
MRNQFYIITGLSGAGKSQALKILEDFGFFCVDNIPLALVPRFTDICLENSMGMRRVALGIDIRAGKSLRQINSVLSQIKKKKINYRIIFFTATAASLLQRYSETRRRHPLGRRVIDGIRRERKMMGGIYTLADQEIDTSFLNLGELKEILGREFKVSSDRKISISLLSFGYKYGIPVDADMVLDVRFIPNPNYVPKLREKTGKDLPVRKYVQKQKMYKKFMKQIRGLVDFLLPNYVKEGKSYLTIAVGCTGGHHRSVVVAESLAAYLGKKKYSTQIYHRDISR